MPQLFLPNGREGLASALHGFSRAHPNEITLCDEPTYLTARHRNSGRQVALVSGGGSGHEPLHGGFLGPGLLDAVAPGQVFASPHNRQVYEASRAVALPGGVLHIVKNYTGDRINFGIAAERLRAEGIEVERVLVNDDVATESEHTATGRRGTAATVIVEKIVGAAADRGMGLSDLARLGNAVSANARSIAVASEFLTSVHTGARLYDLPAGELEYGIGIHGERAAASTRFAELDTLIDRMLNDILGSLDDLSERGTILFVNGLGAATPLELYAVFNTALDHLAQRGIHVAGSLVGTLVSALDMHGFSMTVLNLAEDDWLDLWRENASAPGWTGGN
ncbi:dihydroxyacetone kinase subunit DhaK [Leucobacter sp. wl10]|uniref:dihydroxyacetone kinase subunit DhaK n=1 Tax=Leucobacter sp. wl10 TaxID=2304677 RepID=UPI000E5A85FD|nr:dihydroxyacetone kinase subunit DhaK [Leucobacter sp. wl10]RGE19255.1 dihydroxyacetone kinase subunit DhaK [Leucobacter sp. wl10]